MEKRGMINEEHWKMRKKHKGCSMLIFGALIFGNVYWFHYDWAVFFGGILVLAGLLNLIMPCCKHRRK